MTTDSRKHTIGLRLSVMHAIDTWEERLGCTRQEARYFLLGRESFTTEATLILREMIADAKDES